MNARKISYALTTGLVAIGYAFAGAMYLTDSGELAAKFTHLGYPAHFLALLGTWKLLGAAAVAAPGFARLKEWAYAGMVFNLTAAIYTHARVGDPVGDMVSPAIFLALVVASYTLRPASRRLEVAPGATPAVLSAPALKAA